MTKRSKYDNLDFLTVKLILQNCRQNNPMTNLHSPTVSLALERLFIAAVLTAVVIVSMPLRAIATQVSASAMIPAAIAAVTADQSKQTESKIFTIPDLPKPTTEELREARTGYKVVRVYSKVPTTAYTSRPEETDDSPFIAADGTHVYDGMVAANFLKFGTKVRLPDLFGDKVFEVHDRMNKRYNIKVDIWMTNLKDARKHGVRHTTIEIVEEATPAQES